MWAASGSSDARDAEASSAQAVELERRLSRVTEELESATEALDSLDEVDAALASVLGDAVPEEVEIRIHADRDARHGVAIELLQHLRVRGFVQVQLVALGQPNPSGSFSSRPEARPSVNPTPEPATEDAR